MAMDKLDRQLLALLQTDASRAHADLAKLVNLSPSQVSRRIARLEAEGYIRATVALPFLNERGETVEPRPLLQIGRAHV